MKTKWWQKVILEDIHPGKDLPKRCFVSHSYKDAAAVKDLRNMLPDNVEIVVFPRSDPDPEKAVSEAIVPKILDCPGLIYVMANASRDSFWVSFERDYALRSNRDVFAYFPKTHRIQRDRSAPLPLNVTVVYHRTDEERVDRLLSWMEMERHFTIAPDRLRSDLGGFTGDIVLTMEYLLINGGVVLWLMGPKNVLIAQSFYDPEFLKYLDAYGSEVWQEEGHPLPKYDPDFGWLEEPGNAYKHIFDVFARIDAEFPADWTLGSHEVRPDFALLDLYEGREDGTFNWNRVDDLIIRIYARILQATESERA